MTMAAAIEGRTADARTWSNASRIAGVDIFHDLAAAEAIWRGFETSLQSFTPYQRFDFLAAWQRQVGEREGLRPFIVVAHDAERRPLMLLPLAIESRWGARCASFMGGKHSTFNMALCDRDFAAIATEADLATLIASIADRSRVDALALHQQPLRWRDLPNPLALLPHQSSANGCPLLVIEPGAAPADLISNSFRRRLKGKERKLQPLPGFRYYMATESADISRLLDWFFRLKPQRMAEQKLPNVFAEPGVEQFIRTACLTPLADGTRHIIDIHALECDEEIIAIFAGVADGHRFSMMFNTYTMSGNAKYSPGLILMRDIIDRHAAENYRAFDLGIGSDEYKRLFCKDDEAIFDSFIPLSLRGRLAAGALSGLNRAKRTVKHNAALFEIAQNLRSMFR
ncbi:GNAT family N-acetyltransferase [Bradyrhizobium sp. ISRA443]|uniref:GNAT family N-acetyltransferase n=1 Tax=unclassified Bradyrhizobium TaxID=2631580 RepID=UPI00247974B6|nr:MULTISPECIES: GNAT family N-acetyltransferase [unclassified Bradyrhizobium]WGS02290.1 GNAT family N-acetyltransferase [Bradyrhizobium sp. ISRA436]WGS09175.1 GNAT family N-acetyltransferase [Bradyrhizobium sp. ISRA437]WGS16064.1 GNAT family N-acetyltransferase [Bradyrhizobium sp. ISRA443]